MAIHLTVYPQGSAGGYGYGAYGSSTALYAQALQNQKSQDSMQIQYSNALWEEKLKNQQLSDQLQYQPYQYAAQVGVGGTYGALGIASPYMAGLANAYAGWGGLGAYI